MASNGIINGPVYEVAKFSTKYLNVPPNKHRLYNALGLMAGLYLGRAVMDVLVGQKPDGTDVSPDYLPAPLKSLHGVLAYDHFSDDPSHRWMKVFDQLAPGITGAIGASMGSVQFFKSTPAGLIKPQTHLTSDKFTIAKAEQTALALYSKPWAWMSALSSVFGSASGFGLFPSFLNYSETLGATFTLRAERTAVAPWLGKGLQADLLNSYSATPFRAPRVANNFVQYLAGNPAVTPEKAEQCARAMISPYFKHADKKQIDAFLGAILKERAAFVSQAKAGGKSIEQVEKEVAANLNKWFSETKFEELLIKSGIDPRHATVGDMGFITRIARHVGDITGMGTSKKIGAAQEHLRHGLEARHPEIIAKFGEFKPRHYETPMAQKIASGAFFGVGTAELGLIASSKDTSMSDLTPDTQATLNKSQEKKMFSEQVNSRSHVIHSKRKHGMINGKVLDTAEGITGMLNASIGLHRVGCAAGLTAGSWLGDKVMEALTGVSFAGKAVSEEKILPPLKKLYKSLAFNPHSDLPHDKWMQVLRWGVPGIIGAMGVIQGSKMFFADKHKNDKKAVYLDEVEDAATHAQSKPWNYTAAVTSLFGFPSGLPMLPLVNYSTNLGTRYSMASGRKVALPVIGKYWSNNATLFPYGPPGMLNLLVKEAVNNKSYDPELFETFAIGILKPWFKNVTPQQIEDFVLEVHKVRDQFFKEGGVPEELKSQLEKELNAHLHGAGLEETLRDIGLDPAKATIGENGWSGKIAHALGAKKPLEHIKEDYREGYRKRLESQRDTPGSSFVASLPN